MLMLPGTDIMGVCCRVPFMETSSRCCMIVQIQQGVVDVSKFSVLP